MDHLNSLVKNIEDVMRHMPGMVAPMKEELEAAQKNLIFLRDFFGFTGKRCCELEKLKDILILVDRKSCLFYLRSVKDMMNDQLVKEMKIFFSSMVQNFSPAVKPEVREMYIKVLKASKSTQFQGDYTLIVVDEFDLGFLDSLRDNILELSNYKDQILSLHEELRFLTVSFAMYKSSEEPFGQISNYFLEHINAAIIDLACLVIYSLRSNNEENTDEEVAKELMMAVFGLQDIIRSTKEEARKAYDMYIPKSWRLKIKFRTSNSQNIVSSLERYLKEISSFSSERRLIQKEIGRRSYALDPYRLPFHLSELLQKEMQSLIEAFSKLIAKQHLEHGEQFEIQITRLNDFRNQVESLLSSLWRQGSGAVWRRNLWMFVLIEEIRIMKLKFEDLQNQMMDDPREINNPTQGKNTFITDDYAVITGASRMLGIEDQDIDSDSIVPLKIEKRDLGLKADFLDILLSYKEKGRIEDRKLEFFYTCIQSSGQELQRLCSETCTTFSKSSQCITVNNDDALKENLNTLLKNIDVLIKHDVELVAPFKGKLEALLKSLRFLSNFLGFTAKRCGELEKLKNLLIHSEFLVGNISCLLYLCCDNEKMNDQMVNEMKWHLSSELQKFSPAQPDVRDIYIEALKASNSEKGNSVVTDEFDLAFLDSLREDILALSDTNLSFVIPNKDQILFLHEELKFLITSFAIDISLEEHDQIFNNLFECINAVIIDIGFVIYSLYADEINEKMARELELNKKISDSLASIVLAKEYARKMYDLYETKPLRSEFPRTNGQGFIQSLLRNLNELLNSKPDLVAPLKHQGKLIQKELLSLTEDFSRIERNLCQSDELQSQWTRFLDIAYETEFIIDSFLVGGDPICFHKLRLYNMVNEIKTIKTELKAIKNKVTDYTWVENEVTDYTWVDMPSLTNTVVSSKENLADDKNTTKLVIFAKEAKEIIDQLTCRVRKLRIISIVGMPGIGKTTLADSVFRHSSVICNFHVQARCSVSQVFDRRRLLLEILQQVTERKQYDYDDLDQMLYISLKGRRYLILLDDIWDIQAWEYLKYSFPDDEIGSRIILTSRFGDIAAKSGLESIYYSLSPLSEEKSWKMLQVKLFGNKSCPPELVSVGREIAASCKGLPLTIDLVAGLLRGKEMKEWKKVSENLITRLFEDPEGRCWKVLELSYQNLPDDLKPCFLYFAAFPEDANVPTRDLALLWIAEGFVQLEVEESRSLENVAMDILNSLISRGLVIVSRRRPSGGVAASRVHDLLHAFVVAKAQEESFMLKVNGKAMSSPLPYVGVHDQWQKQHRLCIYPDNWEQFLEASPSDLRTTALICAPFGNAFTLNIRSFKFLRVLYAPNICFRYCPEMFTLVLLRVLAIDTFEDSDTFNIILKIHKLQNLESFIMNRAPFRERQAYLLLDKICNMVRLRHICFGGNISIRYCSKKIWEMFSFFDNLQTLYHLRASYEEDIEKILRLMPNLVKLKVQLYSYGSGSYPFPKWDFHQKLESLKVTHVGNSDFYPCKFSFPPYLKKLVLSNFDLPWTEISEIGNLECLEVLKLKDGAFRGPIWDMIDGQFPKLKYLSLCGLDIEEWNAAEDHLWCLEQLHVSSCKKLVELPYCLGEIMGLKVLKLSDCSLSAKNSAYRIKEDQDSLGNEELVVYIF